MPIRRIIGWRLAKPSTVSSAQPHTEHKRRVYLPVHCSLGVVAPQLWAMTTPAPLHRPTNRPTSRLDEGPWLRPPRPARVCAHKVTHDEGIGGVVQLLEQRTEPDRQEEKEQLPGDAAGQNIRLFDAFHRISLTFLFLATTFYAIMALM